MVELLLHPVACVPVAWALLLAAPPTPPATAAPPPVLQDLPLDEAIATSAREGRILVVKGTAVWCGPCKRMDQTTWRDPAVVEWFEAKGLAIPLDVDAHPQDAQRLAIRAMPTLVAFRDGAEVDRVVGYQSGEAMLAWLASVERGETAEKRLAARRTAPRTGPGALSMQERLELADEVAQLGDLDGAAEEYAWLWQNMLRHEPAMVGVRSSFMAASMTRLAARHAPARGRFRGLRDATAVRLQETRHRAEWRLDWIVLNGVIDDPQATLAWFEAAVDDPAEAASIRRADFLIRPLLESTDRWRALGHLERDPLGRLANDRRQLQTTLRMLEGMPTAADPEMAERMAAELREAQFRGFRMNAARLHASLLAADRPDEAARVAAEALRIEPRDPQAMAAEIVRIAIAAQVASPDLRPLLDPRPLVAEEGTPPPSDPQAEALREQRRLAALADLDAAIAAAATP